MESLRFIASTTISGTSTSVTFSNIDNTVYKDLFFLVNARTDRSGVSVDTARLRVNGDTSSSYTARGVYRADSSSTTAFNNGSSNSIGDAMYTTGNTTNAAEMAAARGWLYNIGNTSSGKLWQSDNHAQGFVMYISGNWQSYDKVTSVTFLPGVGTNFTNNSNFTIYGLIAPFPKVTQ
jgi:hypothetical protein